MGTPGPATRIRAFVRDRRSDRSRQALAREKAREASHSAPTVMTPMIVTPRATSGSPHWPLNRARDASTAWVSGLRFDSVWSQSGASVHRQQDPRQQEQRQGHALDDGRQGVLRLHDERERVRQER